MRSAGHPPLPRRLERRPLYSAEVETLNEPSVDVPSSSAFAVLGIEAPILRAIADLGYEAPTPIQERTIPPLLAGRDLIGQAQTGTGKTAAFAIPMLQAIDPSRAVVQALVLTPTRELAIQVAEAIHAYSKHLGRIGVLPVYGGQPIGLQLKRLERGCRSWSARRAA